MTMTAISRQKNNSLYEESACRNNYSLKVNDLDLWITLSEIVEFLEMNVQLIDIWVDLDFSI